MNIAMGRAYRDTRIRRIYGSRSQSFCAQRVRSISLAENNPPLLIPQYRFDRDAGHLTARILRSGSIPVSQWQETLVHHCASRSLRQAVPYLWTAPSYF